MGSLLRLRKSKVFVSNETIFVCTSTQCSGNMDLVLNVSFYTSSRHSYNDSEKFVHPQFGSGGQLMGKNNIADRYLSLKT